MVDSLVVDSFLSLLLLLLLFRLFSSIIVQQGHRPSLLGIRPTAAARGRVKRFPAERTLALTGHGVGLDPIVAGETEVVPAPRQEDECWVRGGLSLETGGTLEA